MNLQGIVHKPVTKSGIFYDSTCMRFLEQFKSERQTVEWWMSEAGVGDNGELLLNGYRVSFWEEENV